MQSRQALAGLFCRWANSVSLPISSRRSTGDSDWPMRHDWFPERLSHNVPSY